MKRNSSIIKKEKGEKKVLTNQEKIEGMLQQAQLKFFHSIMEGKISVGKQKHLSYTKKIEGQTDPAAII